METQIYILRTRVRKEPPKLGNHRI